MADAGKSRRSSRLVHSVLIMAGAVLMKTAGGSGYKRKTGSEIRHRNRWVAHQIKRERVEGVCAVEQIHRAVQQNVHRHCIFAVLRQRERSAGPAVQASRAAVVHVESVVGLEQGGVGWACAEHETSSCDKRKGLRPRRVVDAARRATSLDLAQCRRWSIP